MSLLRPLAASHQLLCISASFRSISVQGNWLTADGNILSFSLVRAGLGWAKSDVIESGPDTEAAYALSFPRVALPSPASLGTLQSVLP